MPASEPILIMAMGIVMAMVAVMVRMPMMRLSVNLLQAVCRRSRQRARHMKAGSETDQTEQIDPIQRN